MDNLTKAIYKRNRICKICERKYGSDQECDNGNCPICIQKFSKKISVFQPGRRYFPGKPRKSRRIKKHKKNYSLDIKPKRRTKEMIEENLMAWKDYSDSLERRIKRR